MRRKAGAAVLSAVIAATMISACSKQEAANNAPAGEEQHEPVTLKFYTGDKDYEQKFRTEVEAKVKEKYPYISFEFQGADQGKEIQDLVLAGDSPDIYYQGISALNEKLVKFNLQYDLTDLIKQSNFDLDRIDPAYLDIIKNASASYGAGLYGLPVNTFTPVLYYNKDIFDKFGIAYPKDGMTWDDAYALAEKLTRYEDGVQYRGMTMNFIYLLDNNQLGAPYLHLSEDRSDVNTDAWKSIFTTLTRFYRFPMNAPMDERSRVKEVASFVKDRVSAMHADVTAAAESFPDDFTNWDMVSLPTMKEAPGTNAQINPRFYYLISASKHKEEAFKVLQFVLSDEMQMQASKSGKATVLKNPAIQQAFGQDFSMLKGKHTEALYVNKPVKAQPARDSKLVTVPVTTPLNKEFNNVLTGKKDVNTALRDLEETLNKAILAEQKK
ncbi:glycerol-3-phosphate transporter periplasmic binding protein [Paenibacillus konkukensis]|uniref:Glycerol-3-phosphate transporter periplasmic binding protein n=1 Tax=Paenibacillus konkukensis TaxID=2020716 RepID=A0ABY4RP45_9BACL|nr:ABC transporter substrate-binding protein [Paenibacillus konkukensis]UQZ83792.1 glycerol-3-phosphate transporter periplasmic binding protein [Paenibacillus konkukensis]